MEVVYSSKKVEKQCTDLRAATKLMGGDKPTALRLHSRINALKQAETLRDITAQPQFHFHKLRNKNGRDLEGFFAMDVKSRANAWRLVLQPLDEGHKPYVPCNIDEIAGIVRIVKIAEVSRHYD